MNILKFLAANTPQTLLEEFKLNISKPRFEIVQTTQKWKKRGYVCDFIAVDHKTGYEFPVNAANFLDLLNGKTPESIGKQYE